MEIKIVSISQAAYEDETTLIKPGTQRMLNKRDLQSCSCPTCQWNLKPLGLPEQFPLVIDPDIDP